MTWDFWLSKWFFFSLPESNSKANERKIVIESVIQILIQIGLESVIQILRNMHVLTRKILQRVK